MIQHSNPMKTNQILKKIAILWTFFSITFMLTVHAETPASIKIQTPPGRQGLQPELTLEYDVRSGNGAMGVGFFLDGLPALTRIDLGRGIRFDGRDAYAGFGALLVKQKDGTYRLQGDRSRVFTAIKGVCGLHPEEPCAWKMRDAKGRNWEFGVQGNSFIAATDRNGRLVQGGAALAWALEKVDDGKGNFYNVLYRKDLGQFYPDLIVFSNSKSKSPNTLNYIEFGYEARPDIRSILAGPARATMAFRLQRISVSTGCPSRYTSRLSCLVREYNLKYKQSRTNGDSLLQSVREIDGDDVKGVRQVFLEGWIFGVLRNWMVAMV